MPEDLVALLNINSCDVTISGYGHFGTGYNEISTYALVYKDVAKAPAPGDSTSVVGWMMLLMFGGCILTYGRKRIVR